MVRFLDCGDRADCGGLAAAAHVTYLAVDVRIFLIKGLLRCRSRCGNIRGAWLAVTYRRDQGLVAVSCPAASTGVMIAADKIAATTRILELVIEWLHIVSAAHERS